MRALAVLRAQWLLAVVLLGQPGILSNRIGVAWETYRNSAATAWREGRFADAEPALRAALGEAERFGPADQRLAATLVELGVVLQRLDRPAEAEPLYQRALKVLEQAVDAKPLAVVAVLQQLGLAQAAQGKLTEAELTLRRGLGVAEAALRPAHEGIVTIAISLGDVLVVRQNFGEAETLFRRALAAQERGSAAGQAAIPLTLARLANVFSAQGRYTEAEPLATLARELVVLLEAR